MMGQAHWLVGSLITVLMASPIMPRQDVGTAQPVVISQDRSAAARCMRNGPHGFRNVRMTCTLDAEGRPSDCELVNPTPALARRERVFQCMASHIRWGRPDGQSPAGAVVRITLGGTTTWDWTEAD
jgi:hypothetical protein